MMEYDNNVDYITGGEIDNEKGLSLFSGTQISGHNITLCQQDQEGVSYFEAFAALTGTVIGLTNLVVVIVIAGGGRKLRKVTFFCICNLAVADMLAGMLLLWIFGLQKFALSVRTAQSELYQKSVWAMTVWSSVLSQLVIAIDRYLCVMRRKRETSATPAPFKWTKDRRKKFVKVGIVLTWLLPILTYVIPVATFWNCASSCSCYKPLNATSDVYFMICFPVDHCSLTNPPFTKGSMLYLGLSLIVMPTFPCLLYFRIYHFVNNSAKKCKTSQSRHSSSTNSCEPDSRSLPRGHRINGEADMSQITRTGSRVVRVLPVSPTNSSEEKHGQTQFASETVNLTEQRSSGVEKRLSQKQNTTLSKFCKKKAKFSRGNSVRLKIRLKPLISASGTFTKTIAKFRCKRELRLLRTLMIILVFLVICTVPLGVLFLVSFTETDKRYVLPAKYILTASLINSMVNPWVYFWRFLEMRTAFKKMFCSHCY